MKIEYFKNQVDNNISLLYYVVCQPEESIDGIPTIKCEIKSVDIALFDTHDWSELVYDENMNPGNRQFPIFKQTVK